MEIKLKRLNDAVHLEATNASGNTVQIDGSPAIGGQDLGARPMELLLMGLGGCSSMDMISILTKQKQVIEDYAVTVKAERDTDNIPSLFTKIHVEFTLKGDINPKKAERAMSLSMEKYCSVTKIMEHTAEITHSLILVND